MTQQGFLLAFEGPDGAGKTTLSKALHRYLLEQGLESIWLSFPGSAEGMLGKLVYDVHHHPEDFGINALNPTSKQILHIAAHVDTIISIIRPAIQAGKIVILDRYWWSTWVYGRVSGVSVPALDAMLRVEIDSWGEILPLAVFLLSGQVPKRKGETETADKWKELSELYQELASLERSKYSVELISDDGAVDNSLQIVLDSLVKHIKLDVTGTKRNMNAKQ
jgi:dTMP kinase